jgi:hypothetical protein
MDEHFGATTDCMSKTHGGWKKVAEQDKDGGRKENLQNSLTHEDAAPDADDSNERADDRVRSPQPDGVPVPRWREGRTTSA